jgi:hypothetical protein
MLQKRPPKTIVSIEDRVSSSVSTELELGSDGRPLHQVSIDALSCCAAVPAALMLLGIIPIALMV